MSEAPGRDSRRLLSRALGPQRPELSCEQCFAELDRYAELRLAPDRAARFRLCAHCKTPRECERQRDCLGMRAHLEGCPACAEDLDSLLALLAEDG